MADLPNYSRFWNEIERTSLVVIDDLWTAASNNEHVSNAFKVYSKKQGFSIIIVTQVRYIDTLGLKINLFLKNFFESGKYSQNIRQNSEIVVLFENYGNYSTNKSAAEKLGFGTQYAEAADYAYNRRYGYILINKSPALPNKKFRMCSNFFGENDHPFPIFFCEN